MVRRSAIWAGFSSMQSSSRRSVSAWRGADQQQCLHTPGKLHDHRRVESNNLSKHHARGTDEYKYTLVSRSLSISLWTVHPHHCCSRMVKLHTCAGLPIRCSLSRPLVLSLVSMRCILPRWCWCCGLSASTQAMSGGRPRSQLAGSAGGNWPTVGRAQPSCCALACRSPRLPSSIRSVDSTDAPFSTIFRSAPGSNDARTHARRLTHTRARARYVHLEALSVRMSRCNACTGCSNECDTRVHPTVGLLSCSASGTLASIRLWLRSLRLSCTLSSMWLRSPSTRPRPRAQFGLHIRQGETKARRACRSDCGCNWLQ